KTPAGPVKVYGLRECSTITLGKVGQNIACVIENFFPEELSVKWKEDGQEVTGRDWTTEKCPGSTSYKVISLFAASQDSVKKDTEYTCEVKHLNKTYPHKMVFKGKDLRGCCDLKINGPLQKEVFVNKKAKLHCVITGENEMQVKGANVSWTFGGQNVEQTSITDGQVEKTTDQLYTKTSTLTMDKDQWFSGKTVKCSTLRGDEPVSDEIAFKSGGDPSVLIYKPDTFTFEANVSMLCEVKGSNLGDVYVMWKLNNRPYEEGNGMTRINNKDKTSVVLSYFTMPGKDYNGKNIFTCAVQYATKDSLKQTATSMSKDPCPECQAD
uniref:Ig-like domain-containing protein n=1 Tax=Astyanax mexicanus TaxID=7994 RepID=A0A8B9JZF7_ASTMX